jgi:hypothetical protein
LKVIPSKPIPTFHNDGAECFEDRVYAQKARQQETKLRKANLKKNHDSLDEAIDRYYAFLKRIIDAQRVVGTAAEKRDIAESVLLRLCAYWESFVEEHLVDCINVDHSKLKEYFHVAIPANPSKGLCQALILGPGYKDFRSMADMKGFAKAILDDSSNPFLSISKPHAKGIDEVYKIRNYLAHYSSVARRSLHAMYRNEYGMTRFLEPGQFLLGYKAKRLWSYFDDFKGASADMKSTYS